MHSVRRVALRCSPILIALTIAACSRTLPPTESRLGSPASGKYSNSAPHGRNIPSAFANGGQTSRTSGRDASPFQGLASGRSGGDTVYFTSDSVDLTPEARDTLVAQASWLGQHRDRTITIEGHADERGTREYNIGLGQKRAEAVRAFLVSRGVDGQRVRSTSFGKERPVVSCPDISCWSQNRRAQTVLGGAAQSGGYGVPHRHR